MHTTITTTSIYLSIYLSIFRPIYLYIYLSIYLSTHLSTHLSRDAYLGGGGAAPIDEAGAAELEVRLPRPHPGHRTHQVRVCGQPFYSAATRFCHAQATCLVSIFQRNVCFDDCGQLDHFVSSEDDREPEVDEADYVEGGPECGSDEDVDHDDDGDGVEEEEERHQERAQDGLQSLHSCDSGLLLVTTFI